MRPGPESETGCGRDGEEEERSHQARAERHEDGTRVGRATGTKRRDGHARRKHREFVMLGEMTDFPSHANLISTHAYN